MSELRLIQTRDVLAMFPVSRATLDRYVDAGHFPAPITFGTRGRRWYEHEVRAWLAERDRKHPRQTVTEAAA